MYCSIAAVCVFFTLDRYIYLSTAVQQYSAAMEQYRITLSAVVEGTINLCSRALFSGTKRIPGISHTKSYLNIMIVLISILLCKRSLHFRPDWNTAVAGIPVVYVQIININSQLLWYGKVRM